MEWTKRRRRRVYYDRGQVVECYRGDERHTGAVAGLAPPRTIVIRTQRMTVQFAIGRRSTLKYFGELVRTISGPY